MARFNVRINSEFTPFSFDRYMQPLQIYANMYERQEAALDALDEQASQWERLADMAGNEKSYAKYKAYADDLRQKAYDFHEHGLTPESRQELMDLRRRYRKEVKPIEENYKRWQELEKEQRLFSAQNNFNVRYDNDYSQMRLDDFIANPNQSYTAIKGDDVINKTAALSKQALQAIVDNPEITEAERGLLITKMQSGATLQQLNKALQMGLQPGETGDAAVDALLQVARTVDASYQSNGAYDANWMWNNIAQGLYGGVGTTTYNIMQDPSYSSPLQWAQQNLAEEQFKWQKEQYEEEKNKPVVKVDAKTGRTTVYDPKTGQSSVLNPDGSVAIGADGSGSDYTTTLDHVVEVGVKGNGKDKIVNSSKLEDAPELLKGTKLVDYVNLTNNQKAQVDKQIRGDSADNYTYYTRDASRGFLGAGIVGDRHETVIIVPKKQRRTTGVSSTDEEDANNNDY